MVSWFSKLIPDAAGVFPSLIVACPGDNILVIIYVKKEIISKHLSTVDVFLRLEVNQTFIHLRVSDVVS